MYNQIKIKHQQASMPNLNIYMPNINLLVKVKPYIAIVLSFFNKQSTNKQSKTRPLQTSIEYQKALN